MPTLQQRRGLAADLQAANELPAAGQIYFETDTNRVKIGDGERFYNQLPYLSDSTTIADIDNLQTTLDANAAAAAAAQSTADAAVSDAATAQSTADAATTDLSALTTRVTTAESDIDGVESGLTQLNNDPRLTDKREWSADTVSLVEAEAGTSQTRRAWSALRVVQAISAWWNRLVTVKPAGSPAVPYDVALSYRYSTDEWIAQEIGRVGVGSQPFGGWPSGSVGDSLAGKASTSHAHTHSTGGSDAITPASIGAQPAGSYATLVGGTVPAAQLPSYVDDVVEGTLATFPNPGEAGKIYVDTAVNKGYRWSGSQYTEIASSPGTTDVIAEGSVNLYYTDARVLGLVGTTVQTICAGDDARLSDARTPTTHSHPISQVTSLQTSLDAKADKSGTTFTGDVIGTNFSASGTFLASNGSQSATAFGPSSNPNSGMFFQGNETLISRNGTVELIAGRYGSVVVGWTHPSGGVGSGWNGAKFNVNAASKRGGAYIYNDYNVGGSVTGDNVGLEVNSNTVNVSSTATNHLGTGALITQTSRYQTGTKSLGLRVKSTSVNMTGTLASQRGIEIDCARDASSTGTFLECIGLHIDALTTATDRYAIKTEGASDHIYLSGPLRAAYNAIVGSQTAAVTPGYVFETVGSARIDGNLLVTGTTELAGATFTGDISFNGNHQLLLSRQSKALAFSGDTNTGIDHVGTGQVAISCSNTDVATFRPTFISSNVKHNFYAGESHQGFGTLVTTDYCISLDTYLNDTSNNVNYLKADIRDYAGHSQPGSSVIGYLAQSANWHSSAQRAQVVGFKADNSLDNNGGFCCGFYSTVSSGGVGGRYQVYAAGDAPSAFWGQVGIGISSGFTEELHVVGDVRFTNITDGTTTRSIADVMSPPWGNITGKPTTFAPSSHTHAISDVTNLQTELNGKASTSHTHPQSAITDLVTDLAKKVASDTTQAGGGTAVNNIVIISQTDYNNLPTKDANTIYFIT